MTFDENNPLYRFYHEVINQKKFEVLDEIYAPGYVNRIAPFGLDNGVDGVKKLIKEQAAAFPDWHISVDYVIEQGDKTIVKWTLRGTQTGTYFGYKPTGKSFEITGVDIETIVDGKITEHDGAEDMLSLLQQIGAVPLTFD
ncbi:MAG: ester cyclase [Pseudomonadota bacterium]